MVYDTGTAVLERMEEFSLNNNEPTLKYFEVMFTSRAEEWGFPELSSFS